MNALLIPCKIVLITLSCLAILLLMAIGGIGVMLEAIFTWPIKSLDNLTR